jgi:hypothetical protein
VDFRPGRDHKLYPCQMPPPLAWRWQVVRLTHELAHGQGLTERATQAALAERGYRRSAGTIHADLERLMPTCARCREASLPAFTPGAGFAGPAPW